MADHAAGKADWAAMGLALEGREAGTPRLRDLARSDVPRFGPAESVGGVRAWMEHDGWSTGVVVNDEQIVLGRVYGSELDDAPDGASVREIMASGPSTFRSNVSAGKKA